MTKKSYPKTPKLQQLFIEAMNGYLGFESTRIGTLLHIWFDEDEFYVYFKCVTPEGNPHPIEHQRAQLPFRTEFNEVLSSSIPFLFLGYDVDNDVYICWEPAKVKPRLNKKQYVSFYSRLSAQQSVQQGDIKDEVLSNGDKFVLFKREDTVPFFQMIDQHFDELKKRVTETYDSQTNPEELDVSVKTHIELQGKLSKVEDDISIKLLIDSLSSELSCLQIVAECMNNFGDFYVRMTFADWAKIIRTYLQKKEL